MKFQGLLSNILHSKKERGINNDSFIEKLNSEAHKRFLSKQYESAVALADKILLIDKDHYDALTLRAMSFQSLGYFLDAIEDFNRVIELRPFDGNIFGMCGLCYNSIGECEKAKAYLMVAIEKGMEFYSFNLNVIFELSRSKETFELFVERGKTPERRKRRTDKDFTISKEPFNNDLIIDGMRDYYLKFKDALQIDPKNEHIKEIVNHYKKYFEEN